MYCLKCGTQLPYEAKFCSNCGRKIPRVAESDERSKETGYLCCPKCISFELYTKKSGFSKGGKELANAVITGKTELLAGTIGKYVLITCLKCGKRFIPSEAIILQKSKLSQELDDKIFVLVYYGLTNRAVEFYSDFTKCSTVKARSKVNEIAQNNGILDKSRPGCLVIALIIVLMVTVECFLVNF